MELLNYLWQPFLEFGFMRRALIGCLIISLSAAPIGVFLLYRRMSLIGDALSHGVLPGVAAAYLLVGPSLMAMGIGGFIAGLIVALSAGFVSRKTGLKEDASFAGFYLASLALGVTLVSLKGSNRDLMHFLFGSILAVDEQSLIQIGIMASFSVLILALIYRILLVESFDKTFMQVKMKRQGALVHAIFLGLVVLNLIAGFQILGTLMTVGLLVLPATAASFWSKRVSTLIPLAILFSALSSLVGLEWSYHFNMPSGPAIILSASLIFFFSCGLGCNGGMLVNLTKRN